MRRKSRKEKEEDQLDKALEKMSVTVVICILESALKMIGLLMFLQPLPY